MTVMIRYARHAGLAALFIATALAGTLSGVLFAYSDDLPQISAIDGYAPNTITRVLGKDGALVGDFAVERRVVIRYEDIPPVLRQAILSAEDATFFEHVGLNPQRIALALVSDLVQMRKAGGASTLTQQLARKLFLTDEKTWERKIKEAILTIQLEKRYTKEEIFTLYCNQMYFGHGAYGVEAASQMYFGKPVKDLSLEEAAMIAGILQGNARQSPFVNMDAALRRRNYTLNRMAEEGYISRADADAAIAKPIVTRSSPSQGSSIAPYFLEEVRKQLEAKYGAKVLYESGLTVRTALDLELQAAANRAIDRGLRVMDKRRGFRKVTRTVDDDKQTIETWKTDRWLRPMAPGDVVPAVVAGVDRARNTAHLRVGPLAADLARPGFQWTGRANVADILKPGHVVQVALNTVDAAAGTATVTLEQEPLVEGALVALNNHTGQVLALVGGHDFARSKFNRATQAYRQMGSTVKPILYTAAIDRGLTPTTIIVDEPTTWEAGPNQPPYAPGNYDGKFEGPITLRRALEDSRNIPAVKVIDMLGPVQVAAYARKFGFSQEFRPFLSMALGAQEATLLETTSAYTAFPNHGIRMEPTFLQAVVDREGALLEEHRPEPRDAIRADTAYMLTSLLEGVVLRGTAFTAASLKWPLGGKTGTVDDYTDAWFVGFDPDITVGVWIGYDEKKPIGRNVTGAVGALPIWIDFFKAYIDLYGNRDQPPVFDPPGNIVFLSVDKHTGDVVPPSAPDALEEAFISGTQPAAARY